jgi:hypothetical protein
MRANGRARIRWATISVPISVLHGPDAHRGFPLEAGFDGWEPFQMSFAPCHNEGYQVIEMWLREVDA